MIRALIGVILAGVSLSGAGRGLAPWGHMPPPHAPYRVVGGDTDLWVDALLTRMTLDEKLGQLVLVHLPDRGRKGISYGEAEEAVQKYGVSGFLVGRLLPPDLIQQATTRLQAMASVPLFFAADYERGVGRFDNDYTELPSNMALGATRDTLLAAEAGRLTAIESRRIGVNLLFAPVVDVNNNPGNPIINVRSYGEDAGLVARMAASFVRSAEANGVLTTLKHFPGHGNTTVDSHARMGKVEGSLKELEEVEFRPYRVLLKGAHRPAGVMTAHLWVPALDADPLPATFSRHVLQTLLRDRLGFDGLIVTDDVRMGALNRTYGFEDRVVRPLLAGADLILTPESLPGALQALRKAVEDGRLSRARIDASVRRILRAKARLTGDDAAVSPTAGLSGAQLARRIADGAVTLLKTSPHLPLRSGQRIVLVQLSNYTGSESIDAAMSTLENALQPVSPRAAMRVEEEPGSRETGAIMDRVAQAEVIVLTLYLRLQSGRGAAGLYPRQLQLVRALLATGKPVVLVTFGNPYVVTPFRSAAVLLVAYDQTLASVAAVGDLLLGRQSSKGQLPVTVAPYAFGSGLYQESEDTVR